MDLWDYIFVGVLSIAIVGLLIVGYNTPEKYKAYQEGNVTIVERIKE